MLVNYMDLVVERVFFPFRKMSAKFRVIPSVFDYSRAVYDYSRAVYEKLSGFFFENLVFTKFASVGKISLSSSFFSLRASRSNVSKSLVKSEFCRFTQIEKNGHFPLILLYDLIVQQLRLSFSFLFCMQIAGELLLLPHFIFKEIHPWAMQLRLLPPHVPLFS